MTPLRNLVAGLALACSASAWAAPYDNLFVFGDSLSDPGNALAIGGGFGGQFPPNYGYPLPITRFTNGPTAAEQLAARLGVPSAGSYTPAGGPNHAVGGALAGTGNLNWLANLPAGVQTALPALQNTGALSQVARFGGNRPAFDAAQSLFMVWAGANDFFLWTVNGTPQTLAPTAIGSASSVGAAIDTLYGLGARQFLVLNQPDLGAVPATGGDAQASAAGTAYTQVYNGTLAQLLAQAEASRPDARFQTFDVAGLFGSVIASPGAFGFTDVTAPCVADPAAALGGCAGYLFWDAVHPTAAAHSVLADRLAARVGAGVPLPGTVALLLAGSLAAGGVARRVGKPAARRGALLAPAGA